MSPVPPLEEDELEHVVSRPVGPDEAMDTAIVQTFREGNIDVFERDSVLNDWLNADALAQIDWESNPDVMICTRIWGYGVVITPDEVTVYDSPVDAPR